MFSRSKVRHIVSSDEETMPAQIALFARFFTKARNRPDFLQNPIRRPLSTYDFDFGPEASRLTQPRTWSPMHLTGICPKRRVVAATTWPLV